MALDPSHNVVYLVDNQAKGSLGVLRANYISGANNGNGSMDVATLFSLGGAPPNQPFPAEQTGCAFAGAPGAPNSALLDPEGNLWADLARAQ